MEIPMLNIVSHSILTYIVASKLPFFTCESTLTCFFFLQSCPAIHPGVLEEPTCMICNYFYRRLTPLQKADLGTMFMRWVLCDCAERDGDNCQKCRKRCVKIVDHYISQPL